MIVTGTWRWSLKIITCYTNRKALSMTFQLLTLLLTFSHVSFQGPLRKEAGQADSVHHRLCTTISCRDAGYFWTKGRPYYNYKKILQTGNHPACHLAAYASLALGPTDSSKPEWCRKKRTIHEFISSSHHKKDGDSWCGHLTKMQLSRWHSEHVCTNEVGENIQLSVTMTLQKRWIHKHPFI